ncbi:MAG: ArsR/SmtB family transcription factor [Promethearchaeia archaeon]
MEKEDYLTGYIVSFLEVLADPIRLEIIKLMKDGPIVAKDVEKQLDISQSYTSQQLKTLKKANLINVRKDGTLKHYSIKNRKIYKVLSVISSYVIEQERNKFNQLSKLHKRNSL